MKNLVSGVVTSIAILTLSVSAVSCPLWECQYDVNDYSCGCSSSYSYSSNSYYEYNEYSTTRQAIYCQYCGHETWDCVCGGYSTGYVSYDDGYDCSYYGDSGCSGDYGYDSYYDACYDDWDSYGDYSGGCSYDNSYSSSGYQMSHWANIRDCYGNIVGQAGCGDSIEVCGVDSSNPDRVLIYDYSTGCYGSVLAECVYGGYQWDGTGDNGYYNQYQGNSNTYSYDENEYNYAGRSCDEYYDCSYDSGYSNCNSGGCGYGNYGAMCAYSTSYYQQIVETIVQQVAYQSCGYYSYSSGYGGGCNSWC